MTESSSEDRRSSPSRPVLPPPQVGPSCSSYATRSPSCPARGSRRGERGCPCSCWPPWRRGSSESSSLPPRRWISHLSSIWPGEPDSKSRTIKLQQKIAIGHRFLWRRKRRNNIFRSMFIWMHVDLSMLTFERRQTSITEQRASIWIQWTEDSPCNSLEMLHIRVHSQGLSYAFRFKAICTCTCRRITAFTSPSRPTFHRNRSIENRASSLLRSNVWQQGEKGKMKLVKLSFAHKRHPGIDYRCADGRFLMSPRGMAVSNTRYLSSSETRVNAGIRGWILHLSESNWCQESVGGICFTNKWRAASLQPLTFSNYC